MKILLTFDPLMDPDIIGLKNPTRIYFELNPIEEINQMGIWHLMSVDKFEYLQPHIKELKDIWNIFDLVINNPFHIVLEDLISKTGKGKKDSCLAKYFDDITDEFGIPEEYLKRV